MNNNLVTKEKLKAMKLKLLLIMINQWL